MDHPSWRDVYLHHVVQLAYDMTSRFQRLSLLMGALTTLKHHTWYSSFACASPTFLLPSCIGTTHLRDLKRRLPCTTTTSTSPAGSPTGKQGNGDAIPRPPSAAIGDTTVGSSYTVGNSHTGAEDNVRVGRLADPDPSEGMVRPNALVTRVVERMFHQGDKQPIGEKTALQHSQRHGLGLRQGEGGSEGDQKGSRGVPQLETEDAAGGLDKAARTVKGDISTLVVHEGVVEESGDGFRSTRSGPSELFDSLDLSVS